MNKAKSICFFSNVNRPFLKSSSLLSKLKKINRIFLSKAGSFLPRTGVFLSKVNRFFALKVVCIFLSAVLAISFLCGCKNESVRNFFAADTFCSISIFGNGREHLDGAVSLCNSLSRTLDCKNKDSELYALNLSGHAENVNEDLKKAIEIGLYYSKLSDGIFDITVKPVTDLWDFKSKELPEKSELLKAAKLVNYKNVEIIGNNIVLKNNCKIDLGSLGKGYIADRVRDYLVERNVGSAIINLGGNVTVIGKNKNRPFSVGIQKPFSNGLIASFSAEDCSVVTSGTYQRYIEKDSVIYHHLLSTKTGMPVQNGITSVTVITKDSEKADPLSTLLFLMGYEKGMEFVKKTDGIEAVFIDANGEIRLSPGLDTDKNMNIFFKSDL